MTPQTDKTFDDAKPAAFEVLCAWCGTVIRTSTIETPEQMCLICHARMLNDYFQRLRQLSNEKRRS
ncbi:MAG TPA: hypothetical protein VGJ37_12180 [Pyrinomonadaceae bacterium]